MSDELDALRLAIETGDYTQALALIDEMDDMSREDKINRIKSYMVILLQHLIKQQAEGRLTPSWRRSLRHATREIAKTNLRQRAGGAYLDEHGLTQALSITWPDALADAADEAFGGRHTPRQLASMVDKDELLQEALRRILARQAGREEGEAAGDRHD